MKIQLAIFTGVFLVSLLAWQGCGPNYIYKHQVSIAEGGWAYADSAAYAFVVEDTLGAYDLYLDIEHGIGFAFQNMYTKVHTVFPDGKRRSQVLSITLADKAGQWYGQCGGEACSLRLPFQQGAYFGMAGEYKIVLEQYMRVDPLAEVQSLGLSIVDTGKKR